MAKRSRASARKSTRAPARPRKKPALARPPSRSYTYTPELMAEMRRRYEETDEKIVDLAAECGIHADTFQRMANREHWVRFKPPPRDLSPAAKLALEAEALPAGQGALTLPPRSGGEGRLTLREQGEPGWGGDVSTSSNAAARLPPTPDPSPPFAARTGGGDGKAVPASSVAATPALIASLRTEAEQQLAEAQAMRGVARNRVDRERNSRTLLNLTTVIERIRRLEAGLPLQTSGQAYDDMPADLDAFREALAQRIEAFLASAPDEDDAEPAGAARTDLPRA